MSFDLVINNGTIVDGTGRPRYRSNLGIRDGRVSAISRQALDAPQVLDADGLVVAPGFIDFHSHGDWILPLEDHPQILAPLLLQGITTLVTGQCGFSPAPVTDRSIPLVEAFSKALRERSLAYPWRSMAGFLDTLEEKGVLLNIATLVGHGTLRYAVMGDSTEPPTPDELDALCDLARQAVEQGAFGFSAGLAYDPGIFARNQELSAILETVSELGALFAVHGRAYSWVSSLYKPMILGTAHNLRSVRELIQLARQAGVRLQLSHQIFVGRRTWRTHRKVLREIDRAVEEGVDVAFDAFPYTVGNSLINVVFPEWFLDGFDRNVNDPRALRALKREIDILRLALGLSYPDITLLWGCVPELGELEGLDFGAIARRLQMSEFDAYLHVARVSGGDARILLGTYSGDADREEPLRAALAHPRCAFMTDTILTTRGKQNPASFGTFPRILGRYSRDLGLFGLEEAVRRMTSFSAERIGLAEIGQIAKGYWADLVLFDPDTVADNSMPGRPDAPPSGIRVVLISGKTVAQDGQLLNGILRGRVLRR